MRLIVVAVVVVVVMLYIVASSRISVVHVPVCLIGRSLSQTRIYYDDDDDVTLIISVGGWMTQACVC